MRPSRYGWQWHPTPVLLPGKSHGRRSLVGCSPWGCEELDTTERLHFHFSLSCMGEGNGNPLQCSCLENPRDGGAWWAAVYGVAQSQTRLKRLSSSSSRCGWTPRLPQGCHPYTGSPLLSKYLSGEATLLECLPQPSLRCLFSTLRPLCTGLLSINSRSLDRWVWLPSGQGS